MKASTKANLSIKVPILFFCCLPTYVQADEEVNISSFFTGYQGTFVVLNTQTGAIQRYNHDQSTERLSPCSTFKIANALFALEVGVLKDAEDIIKWDGKKRKIEEWNSDLSLRKAIAVSAVPHFQQIARKIGNERMQAYLSNSGYGNQDIYEGITKFWLGSTLKISAEEQVTFISNMLQHKLPVSERSVKIVKDIIKLESTEKGVLYGKTGSGVDGSGNLSRGWFVGFLGTKDNVYAFATNIKGGDRPGGRRAKEITKDILMAMNFIEEISPVPAATDGSSTETEQLRENVSALQNCQIHPKAPWGDCLYFFEKGKFPEIEWENPYLVEKAIGKLPLEVRWFDADLNEVAVPEKHGRYAAVIEGTTSDGIHIRRAMTVYCGRTNDWAAWRDSPKAEIEYRPNAPINKKAWEERKELIASLFGQQFIHFLATEQKGAVILTYLSEMKPCGARPAKIDTPKIRDNDYHLALKRKLLGLENKYTPLKMPRRINGRTAPILHAGTMKEACVKSDTAEKIRAVCRQWYVESKEPFVVLVARHGVIIIHEAVGEGPRGPVMLDTPMDIASITKTLTALMFAQFVDQNLIAIDDPVGRFLPDFPIKGDKAITLRHCFTHTSGLEGHCKWNGMHNPWLDNAIASELCYVKPGRKYNYNGMGYNLAGKVMEILSGKSIFRLMEENLFVPLGIRNTTMDDMAGMTTSSVEDIARIGQLLLNKGSYGNLEFFSPQTFEKLLPQPLNKFYPDIDLNSVFPNDRKEYSIGLYWMRQPHPEAGKNGVPADKTILSKNVIGHGAGSGAILRVDLDNDLVIAQIRNQTGKAYNKYRTQLFKAVEDGLTK
ncbi:MAG: penicillin-binding transpeptidase domain-containing protein [Planctomycetota bacterium]